MSLARLIGLVVAVMLAGPALPASAADPRVPIGLDPGGPAIALITDGVDYTDPEIAKRLARDGEGEAIAFDLIDGDITPYAPADRGQGTQVVKTLLAIHPKARIIFARAATDDPVSVAKAMIFASRTPAKVTAIALSDMPAETMAIIAQAANAAPSMIYALPPTFTGTKPANLFTAPQPYQPAPAGRLTGQPVVELAAKLSCLLENGISVSELKEKATPQTTCDPVTGQIGYISGQTRF
ncbi:MAG: hypothetical protein K0U74_11360 [Alphaproteobacteria bacterium]|nr:hypothetical protein [Alphaproteobacteria bacterium]